MTGSIRHLSIPCYDSSAEASSNPATPADEMDMDMGEPYHNNTQGMPMKQNSPAGSHQPYHVANEALSNSYGHWACASTHCDSKCTGSHKSLKQPPTVSRGLQETLQTSWRGIETLHPKKAIRQAGLRSHLLNPPKRSAKLRLMRLFNSVYRFCRILASTLYPVPFISRFYLSKPNLYMGNPTPYSKDWIFILDAKSFKRIQDLCTALQKNYRVKICHDASDRDSLLSLRPGDLPTPSGGLLLSFLRAIERVGRQIEIFAQRVSICASCCCQLLLKLYSSLQRPNKTL
jgi:hypothetical protein